MSARHVGQETAALLKLGVVFMASAFLTVGAAYAIRIIVLRADGIEAAGLYQAAWALGGLYVGFILQAMGADFYPRLTAIADNNAECNRLVNEQAQISMLLAGPGVIATLTVAPLVISLFYTPEFSPAVNLLRWICLGMMLRVVAWPMGFIAIAKGARQIWFLAELAATIVHVGLAWLLVPRFGVIGAGAAFFGLYVWHSVLIYLVVRRLTGFRWSSANLKLGMLFLPACGIVFAGFFLLPYWQATVFGAAIVLCSGLYSLKMLLTLLPAQTMPSALRRLLAPSMRPTS
jgi:PST family polysaccharide transporter